MKKKILLASLSVCLLMSGSPVFADDTAVSGNSGQVNEDVFYIYVTEINDNLVNAKESFIQKDYDDAKDELKAAASKIKMEG